MALRTAGSQYARQPYWAVYAGDTWKATPKLSLNYGLRWDLALPVTEKHNILSFFNPNGANPAAGGRLGNLAFAGDEWGSASYGKPYPESVFKKAFAPRVGFAYTVDSRQWFEPVTGCSSLSCITPAGQAGLLVVWMDSIPHRHSPAPMVGSLQHSIFRMDSQQFPRVSDPRSSSNTFRTGQSIGLYRGTEHGRPPYAQQWNLTIERQLTKDTYVTAAYVANKGTRLISGVAAINALDPKHLSLGSQLYDQFCPGPGQFERGSGPLRGWAAQMTGCPPSVAQALLPYPQYCSTFSSINENAG